MSDFADVQQFARQHAACGGLTPNAQTRPGTAGGYLLTITCACGAIHERWVTAEEASQPLPRPAREPAPAPAPTPAPTPRPAPAVIPTFPARPSPPRAQRVALTLPPAPRRPSGGRAVWVVLVLAVALGAVATVYVTGVPMELRGALGSLPGVAAERPVASRAPAAAPSSPPPLPPPVLSPQARQRAALDEIVASLRRLQAQTTPSVSLDDYATHVATTRTNVERLVTEAPEPAQAPAREILDLYRLAGVAWRARTLDDRQEWERVGRDPAIDLCPAVKRAADAASSAPAAARPRARGVAVGAALLPLWECAAERTIALGQTPADG
jgi:hypothetical protein